MEESERKFAALWQTLCEVKPINEPYFEQHLKYQTRHMQLLTRWCLGVMDMLEGRQGAKEAACACLEQLLEARTVLEQGEWKHWHRGDKKINIQLLLDMTKAWN